MMHHNVVVKILTLLCTFLYDNKYLEESALTVQEKNNTLLASI